MTATPTPLRERLVALHNTLLNLDDNGDLPDAIADYMIDAVHEAALSARDEAGAVVCGACGDAWTGQKCWHGHSFPVCNPIATPPASGEAVLTHPARVAGRDFMPGEPVQRVLGRAHAHYDVTHASGEAGAYPTSSDREVLRYLMQQFDAESWECPRCGHSEDCATMDSADYLRRYLATPPASGEAGAFAFDALVMDACKAAYAACDMGPFPEQAVDAENDKRFIGAALRHALIRRLAAVAPAGMDEDAAKETFTTWFCLNYPGPHTIISDPNWHAPRIFRQALWAIRNATPPATAGQE